MKDITVALELTVDEGITDQDVQYFVQRWLRKAIKDSGTSRIDDILVDVKAVADGTFVDFTRPEWRLLEYTR